MPLYESACVTPHCDRFQQVEEHYYSHADSPMQNCTSCGREEVKFISTFNAVWVRPIGEYGDKQKEYYHRDLDGHWVTRKRSTRRADGKPEREYITSVSQQRQYCREEGLIAPDDVGPMEVHACGTKSSHNGMRGQWV